MQTSPLPPPPPLPHAVATAFDSFLSQIEGGKNANLHSPPFSPPLSPVADDGSGPFLATHATQHTVVDRGAEGTADNRYRYQGHEEGIPMAAGTVESDIAAARDFVQRLMGGGGGNTPSNTDINASAVQHHQNSFYTYHTFGGADASGDDDEPMRNEYGQQSTATEEVNRYFAADGSTLVGGGLFGSEYCVADGDPFSPLPGRNVDPMRGGTSNAGVRQASADRSSSDAAHNSNNNGSVGGAQTYVEYLRSMASSAKRAKQQQQQQQKATKKVTPSDSSGGTTARAHLSIYEEVLWEQRQQQKNSAGTPSNQSRSVGRGNNTSMGAKVAASPLSPRGTTAYRQFTAGSSAAVTVGSGGGHKTVRSHVRPADFPATLRTSSSPSPASRFSRHFASASPPPPPHVHVHLHLHSGEESKHSSSMRPFASPSKDAVEAVRSERREEARLERARCTAAPPRDNKSNNSDTYAYSFLGGTSEVDSPSSSSNAMAAAAAESSTVAAQRASAARHSREEQRRRDFYRSTPLAGGGGGEAEAGEEREGGRQKGYRRGGGRPVGGDEYWKESLRNGDGDAPKHLSPSTTRPAAAAASSSSWGRNATMANATTLSLMEYITNERSSGGGCCGADDSVIRGDGSATRRYLREAYISGGGGTPHRRSPARDHSQPRRREGGGTDADGSRGHPPHYGSPPPLKPFGAAVNAAAATHAGAAVAAGRTPPPPTTRLRGQRPAGSAVPAEEEVAALLAASSSFYASSPLSKRPHYEEYVDEEEASFPHSDDQNREHTVANSGNSGVYDRRAGPQYEDVYVFAGGDDGVRGKSPIPADGEVVVGIQRRTPSAQRSPSAGQRYVYVYTAATDDDDEEAHHLRREEKEEDAAGVAAAASSVEEAHPRREEDAAAITPNYALEALNDRGLSDAVLYGPRGHLPRGGGGGERTETAAAAAAKTTFPLRPRSHSHSPHAGNGKTYGGDNRRWSISKPAAPGGVFSSPSGRPLRSSSPYGGAAGYAPHRSSQTASVSHQNDHQQLAHHGYEHDQQTIHATTLAATVAPPPAIVRVTTQTEMRKALSNPNAVQTAADRTRARLEAERAERRRLEAISARLAAEEAALAEEVAEARRAALLRALEDERAEVEATARRIEEIRAQRAALLGEAARISGGGSVGGGIMAGSSNPNPNHHAAVGEEASPLSMTTTIGGVPLPPPPTAPSNGAAAAEATFSTVGDGGLLRGGGLLPLQSVPPTLPPALHHAVLGGASFGGPNLTDTEGTAPSHTPPIDMEIKAEEEKQEEEVKGGVDSGYERQLHEQIYGRNQDI